MITCIPAVETGETDSTVDETIQPATETKPNAAETPVKRKRGRPRKTEVAAAAVETVQPPKRSNAGYVCVSFDIETGPLPDEELLKTYHEPTFEEFCETCDARWKQETKQAKYEEGKVGRFDAYREKAALSALTGQVVAIGGATILNDDWKPTIIGQEKDRSEQDVIATWWNIVDDCLRRQLPMVGHNIHGFDLPFLMQRSWILGIPTPDGILQGTGRRYWHPLFIDTMKEWGFGDNRSFVKLDVLAKAFGLGGKAEGECCGKNFHQFWFSEDETKHQQAVNYLLQDLRLPASIAMAMGVV
jgi:hypothetical protein